MPVNFTNRFIVRRKKKIKLQMKSAMSIAIKRRWEIILHKVSFVHTFIENFDRFFYIASQWQPDDYLTTIWRLPDECLPSSWRLYYLVINLMGRQHTKQLSIDLKIILFFCCEIFFLTESSKPLWILAPFLSEAVEASLSYFFESWMMKLRTQKHADSFK